MREPLPDRWAELIKQLNEQERTRVRARMAFTPTCSFSNNHTWRFKATCST